MGCQILISRFEASVLIHCKIYAKDLCYSPFMLKIHSAWPILSWPNFTNIKYMFLLFCRIFTKQNKVVVNWGYTNVCFMMNDPLKMVLCHFCCFHYYNIKWLCQIFYEKLLILLSICRLKKEPQYNLKLNTV